MLVAAAPAWSIVGPLPTEAHVLKMLAPLASREGETLTLNIAGNQQIKLRSVDRCDAGPDDCMIYELLGLSPGRQFFVVEARDYESATVYWIARSTGKQVDVHAMPQVSPDGSRIVTANPSEYGSLDGIFLWDISKRGLVERFRFEPQSYALYSFVRWSDRNSVELTKLVHGDEIACPSSQFIESAARLVRRRGKWVLEDVNDRQQVCR
jgi:hypothetical protein